MDKTQLTKDFAQLVEKYIDSKEDWNYLVSLAIAAYQHKDIFEKDERTGESSFLTVAGEDFACLCGCNVFSKMKSGRYLCNSCDNLYEGEKSIAKKSLEGATE